MVNTQSALCANHEMMCISLTLIKMDSKQLLFIQNIFLYYLEIQ
jgi:hypothetical protein